MAKGSVHKFLLFCVVGEKVDLPILCQRECKNRTSQSIQCEFERQQKGLLVFCDETSNGKIELVAIASFLRGRIALVQEPHLSTNSYAGSVRVHQLFASPQKSPRQQAFGRLAEFEETVGSHAGATA